MSAQVDRIFITPVSLKNNSYRTTFDSMTTPNPIIPLEKPRRINRPELERFFSEFIQRQNGLAMMMWEYVLHNDERLDQLEEQIKRIESQIGYLPKRNL